MNPSITEARTEQTRHTVKDILSDSTLFQSHLQEIDRDLNEFSGKAQVTDKVGDNVGESNIDNGKASMLEGNMNTNGLTRTRQDMHGANNARSMPRMICEDLVIGQDISVGGPSNTVDKVHTQKDATGQNSLGVKQGSRTRKQPPKVLMDTTDANPKHMGIKRKGWGIWKRPGLMTKN